jgi:hypothetical protein
MSKRDSIEYIKKYGLIFDRFSDVNLEEVCVQYRPEIAFHNLMMGENGELDFSMKNSPHYEFAHLYYSKGLKWMEKNFKKTKYFIFRKEILKSHHKVPIGKIRLFDSVKDGYLKKGFEEKYIVILERPLIETRYGIKQNKEMCSEIFLGHHRAAALLALNIKSVKVIIAKDANSNSCHVRGKLHDIYIKIK